MRSAYQSPTVRRVLVAGDVEIVQVAAASESFAEVLRLHRAAKQYLGPLPDEGFDERAVAGTLLGPEQGAASADTSSMTCPLTG